MIHTSEEQELRTSEEWLKEQPNVIIYDPDGWDRRNYTYSFFEEEITLEEFNKRLVYSTVMRRGR